MYFCDNMFKNRGESIEGKSVAVSGSGNVAIYAVEKGIELGAKIVTMSDSGGFIHDPDGIDDERLAFLKDLKERGRERISKYVDEFKNASYHEGKRPWSVPVDVAMPCATQNEISGDEARELIKNGVKAVCEGANMPTELEGAHAFVDSGILYGPSKAANAGGVAVSGFEQSQNAERRSWSRDKVNEGLKDTMKNIHDKCVQYGGGKDGVNYVKGANIGGFVKVADAMLAYGAV
jgi:glutamate dehydrogenase (NADP+)